jgi:hypothetical protein
LIRVRLLTLLAILVLVLLAALGLQFGPLANAQASPTLTVSPTSGPPGTQVMMTGANFPTFLTLSELTIGGIDVRPIPLPSTGSTGSFTATFTLPYVPSGTEIVRAKVGASTAAAAFAVTGAPGAPTQPVAISLTGGSTNPAPTTVVPNQTLAIIGTGFTTGGAVTINRSGDPSIVAIDDSTQGLKAAGGSPSAKLNEGGQISIDVSGNWGATLIIPINSATTTPGNRELRVTDSGGRVAMGTLTIPSRVLKVDPETSRRGSTVMVTGTGFPVSSTRPTAEPNPTVQIRYEMTGRAPRTVATTFTNAAGEFTASFIIPLDAPIASSNTVTALIGDTTVSETKTHSVLDQSVKLSPESGPPGTAITVTGSNFPPFTPVRSLTIARVQVLPSPAPSTGADGAFTVRIVVPQLAVGTEPVDVRVGQVTALETFRITAGAPAPPLAGSADLAATLAPMSSNLVRVWGFDATTQAFQLYDPAAPALSDLTALLQGRGYWMLVDRAQIVTLGSGTYTLSAGWNLIGWLG